MGLLTRKEKPIIEFIAKVPHLRELENAQPQPANKFIPDWWRSAPYSNDMVANLLRPEDRLVRQCPAFPDLFSSGYILPMWADTTLYFSSKTGEWNWRCGGFGSPFAVTFFDPRQFTDVTDYKFQNQVAKAVFQLVNPWKIQTTKGYSVMQLPLFYNSLEDVSILPGTYDGYSVLTDKLEVAYFTDEKEIFIKQGTPLVQYIPYKKTNIQMVTRDFTDQDEAFDQRHHLIRNSIFKNWYAQNRNRGTNE